MRFFRVIKAIYKSLILPLKMSDVRLQLSVLIFCLAI